MDSDLPFSFYFSGDYTKTLSIKHRHSLIPFIIIAMATTLLHTCDHGFDLFESSCLEREIIWKCRDKRKTGQIVTISNYGVLLVCMLDGESVMVDLEDNNDLIAYPKREE